MARLRLLSSKSYLCSSTVPAWMIDEPPGTDPYSKALEALLNMRSASRVDNARRNEYTTLSETCGKVVP